MPPPQEQPRMPPPPEQPRMPPSPEQPRMPPLSQTGDVTDMVCHHFSLRVTLVQMWFSVFIRK